MEEVYIYLRVQLFLNFVDFNANMAAKYNREGYRASSN